MEKLNTEQKLEIVSPLATPMFVEGKDTNAICEALIIGGITAQGIGFTEVSPLVKQVGKAGGYILTTEQKRENFRAELADWDLSTVKTWTDLEELFETMAEKHSLPEKWSKDCIVATMENNSIPVPKKSTLTDWQKATVEAFKANRQLTRAELDEVIKNADVQNYAHYGNLVHGLCYAIANMDEEE